jgi:4-hydroxy-3-polyprenylbenzoate decarboxylase
VQIVPTASSPRRVVVGISGASGAIYGIRLVETLARLDDVEIHLVMSKGAEATISYETSHEPESVAKLAHVVYDERNVALFSLPLW